MPSEAASIISANDRISASISSSGQILALFQVLPAGGA